MSPYSVCTQKDAHIETYQFICQLRFFVYLDTCVFVCLDVLRKPFVYLECLPALLCFFPSYFGMLTYHLAQNTYMRGQNMHIFAFT